MTRMDVPSFDLYGETASLPDVIHMERIRARSAPRDWRIGTHRHARLHQILTIEAGGGRLTLEGRALPLGPGQVVNLPAGAVHGFDFLPETGGWVLTAPAGLIREVLAQDPDLTAQIARAGLASADPGLAGCLGRLHEEYAGGARGRAQALRMLAGWLATLTARALAAGEAPREDPVLAGFDALVERHMRDHWPVATYAAALAVSPGHLARVVRAARGQPPSRLLRDRLMREARRELAYTARPVAQIGFDLGYADPAHFSRVFRAATGHPPGAFRAAAQKA